ncbi:MAG: hypothetical protein IT365_06335 [Candidatus Hydrogenedentes bacterium]|nr:hypothetical protein [Candidatus Hydrogenedentota bacterium]
MTDSKSRRTSERSLQTTRAWRQRNAEAYRAYQRDYYAKSDKARRVREAVNRHRIAKYGVDNTWVDVKVAEQGGCAICKTKRPRGKTGWNVDHDHKTGKVRGVLCSKCNSGIGLLGDSVEGLRLAVRYLEMHAHLQKQFKALL